MLKGEGETTHQSYVEHIATNSCFNGFFIRIYLINTQIINIVFENSNDSRFNNLLPEKNIKVKNIYEYGG